MTANEQIWASWATTLRRWGLQNWAAAVLEAAGPLTILGAQVVYLGQPILSGVMPKSGLNALSNLLENQQQVQAFAAFLKEQPRGNCE
jgi:hypothetical protein